MRKTLQQRKESGFTIVEVLIVLAIAGLIILIVLLAVPALQRNGRNTATKNDAAAVAGAIQEFRSNNDGSIPTGITPGTGTVDITGAAGSASARAKVSPALTVTTGAAATATNTVVVTLTNGACPGTTASSRTAAVYYWAETSGGGASKCIDA